MANNPPIVKIKRGSGAPASLNTGELAIDLTNKDLYVGDANGVPFTVGGAAPAGTGLVVVDNGSFGSPLPPTNFALAEHVHTTFSATPPLTPKEGDRWVDSSTVRAYEWLSGFWIEIATTT